MELDRKGITGIGQQQGGTKLEIDKLMEHSWDKAGRGFQIA